MPVFGGFVMAMMICSGMNINERYRTESDEEPPKAE